MLPYHIAAPLCFSRKVQDWETKITNQLIGSSINAHTAHGTHILHTSSYTALNHVQTPSVINNITETLLRLWRVVFSEMTSFGHLTVYTHQYWNVKSNTSEVMFDIRKNTGFLQLKHTI
jgi:hypothetical protein